MNGLGVRVARGLNRVMRRRGRVLAERYHGHLLKTPAEVRNARAYLVGNAYRHFREKGADAYESRAPVVAPVTFLMRQLR